MAREIERKFLVENDSWRAEARAGKRYVQGYLPGLETASVRVRVSGDEARLNIKSATLGIHRDEYEYEIPRTDAEEILARLCRRPLIEKTRYFVPFGGHTWEVDVFEGENAGLVVAEVELASPEERFERPPWLGEEVSHDERYYNVALVEHPFKDW